MSGENAMTEERLKRVAGRKHAAGEISAEHLLFETEMLGEFRAGGRCNVHSRGEVRQKHAGAARLS